jgi:hypothetical protein
MMNTRILSLLVTALLVIASVPLVTGVSVGTGVGIDLETEDAAPWIWMNTGTRVVNDGGTRPGRVLAAANLTERRQNYAFEGEEVDWDVLVWDANGHDSITDVFMTVGDTQGTGNDVEAQCRLTTVLTPGTSISVFNVRRGHQTLAAVPAGETGQWATYDCTLTVESPASMQGSFFANAEVTDVDGLSNIADENEYWFFNPVVALSIDGALDFGSVVPGQLSYSDTLLLGNDAEDGSGVMLDMFVSGTNFYDPASSSAKCPTTNELGIENFRYFATSGGYSSYSDARSNSTGLFTGPGTDADPLGENYVGIVLGDRITDAREVICDGNTAVGTGAVRTTLAACGYNAAVTYSDGNQLTPGSELALTFRLDLPSPCSGDYTDGSIFFWGEAV